MTNFAEKSEIINEIIKIYNLRNSFEIYSFLLIHNNAAYILFEVFPIVKNIFGEDTKLILEMITDIEYPKDKSLVAYIEYPSEDWESGMKKLGDIDDWILTKDIGLELNFDLEFI